MMVRCLMPVKAINMLSVVLDSEKQTVPHNKGYKVVRLLNQASRNVGGVELYLQAFLRLVL